MLYRLEYNSAWTSYIVDHYRSIEECMVDCVKRYGRPCIFKRKDERTLEAKLFAEDVITLTLYEEMVV